MKTGFRQSMAVLHTWAGLLPGWLLFIIFLFGTVSFFKQEISTWMQPELRDEALSSVAVDKLWQQLASNAPGAKAWQISLPPQRGGETLRASWQAEEQRQTLQLHPSSGEALTTRDTHGGNFLFSFHYNLYYIPWQLARYLVCIASLLMLVALLSGVVIHRKIFIDFFTLRLGKGQRSWLDVHNITAVVALPFHLMITWTGLATLLLTIMPWAILANFPDPSEFRQAIRPTAPHVQPAGVMAEPMPLSKIIATAEQHFNGVRPAFIRVHHPGDLNAMVEIFPHTDRLGSPHQAIFFSGVNGQLLQPPATPGAAIRTLDVMTDLHSARFADPVLRWLYFFSGVGGTLMIATGLILWSVKRGRQMPASTMGRILVERLNITVIVGASAGIAAYFLANRLLPIALAERAAWEIHCLFLTWAAVLLWTLVRPPKSAWRETLVMCALLFALVPVVNTLATSRGIYQSLLQGDGLFIGFDIAMLISALFFAGAAKRISRPPTSPHKTERSR
ncbi:PepSY-associated TM helix domain-containing protein [Cellvibrio polysaccharolyticus]|uniref:PepSY domain-containing protein n=1 Tax=Cellvibrio polysaccharolyticus TaxID=2082724 RepID=A0A928V351_9GAMM|nr:PepSY-associated TM helix domain-containing protein [Cellvibrio polysaccharolyticus]MBE8716330.1 PepSY domain-containing protein [Cellvibrio polysaccharolyticus]